MDKLNGFSNIDSKTIIDVSKKFGTPIYLYDESQLVAKCKSALSMPNAFGIKVRYAMKANSNKTILQIINKQGITIDASSLNEVKRAVIAGTSLKNIMLTTQEVPEGRNRKELEQMILSGLKYNVCSMRQLYIIGNFAKKNKIDLSYRVHPGIGAGESASRNTGDAYSCFGIHLSDIDEALGYAKKNSIKFTQVHVHIGSGGDPEIWRQNIDLELGFVEKYFPDAKVVSFGGGLKEARMPNETAADINKLGKYAKTQIEKFYQRTGRKLKMEIEPGTYIVANSGYAITKVIDKKQTGSNGFNFAILDGGMDINVRPLLYGSQHPFYIISKAGQILSSEFDKESLKNAKHKTVAVGNCCESGDSQCLDSDSKNMPRRMADPEVGDIVVIGGVGGYCSTMTPFNYNSHTQIPEVLLSKKGQVILIRKRQTLDQIISNEI